MSTIIEAMEAVKKGLRIRHSEGARRAFLREPDSKLCWESGYCVAITHETLNGWVIEESIKVLKLENEKLKKRNEFLCDLILTGPVN